MTRRPLEGLSSFGDHPTGVSAFARAMVHNFESPPGPRKSLAWLVPQGFSPPPQGGICSARSHEGDIWVGTLIGRVGRRVRLRLLGSNVVALFVDCAVAPLRQHTIAEARQIAERQRRYEPAARFSKSKDTNMNHDEHDDEHDTDVDHPIPEPARERGMRVGRDQLPARLDSAPIEADK